MGIYTTYLTLSQLAVRAPTQHGMCRAVLCMPAPPAFRGPWLTPDISPQSPLVTVPCPPLSLVSPALGSHCPCRPSLPFCTQSSTLPLSTPESRLPPVCRLMVLRLSILASSACSLPTLCGPSQHLPPPSLGYRSALPAPPLLAPTPIPLLGPLAHCQLVAVGEKIFH